MEQQRKPTSRVLWSKRRRRTTTGLLLIVTHIAFESMGIATATPAVVIDLDGLGL